jgi:phosphoglycerate dehydrogenase-like enzyme
LRIYRNGTTKGTIVTTGEQIVISQHTTADGLAAVQALVGAEAVKVVPMLDDGEALPPALAAACTVLLTDAAPANLREMRRLRWMQLSSAGYEHMAGLPLAEMGVTVTNASGVNDVPIVEWCLAMLLMFERDMRGLLAMQQQRGWNRLPKYQSELRGRRVGVIGYGSIGRELARACTCLGLDVWAMSRSPIGPRHGHYAVAGVGDPEGIIPSRTFSFAERDTFLAGLDYLVLTLPLSPATTGLIGERELRALPQHAVILNPSRGRLIDEDALLRALREGWIAGAALDTHFHYPLPPEHPLWSMPNVVLTPHISGSTGSRQFLPRLWDLFAQNLGRHLRGEPLLNVIAAADLGAGSHA